MRELINIMWRTIVHISVPNQNSENSCKYQFLIMVKPKCYIGIPYDIGMTLLFSGQLLTHRQHCHPIPLHNEIFYNLASYGNKRLFYHLRKSVLRKKIN